METPEQSTPARPGRRGKSTLRTILVLFFLSLAIRVAVWAPVAHSRVPPIYDEVTYVERATAYENLAKSYLKGAIFWADPSERDLRRAYRKGVWPPLHPVLLGLTFAVLGRSLAIARFVVVLQSAATTCVVFALTSRLATRRAALIAAGIHIVYASFVAFSHLLWSETTYILMGLSALYFAVRAADEQRLRRQLLFAVLAGVFLGLAGLTRAAVLPLLIALPAWLLWKVKLRQRRWLLPVTLLGASLLVLSPWQATLWKREGRFTALSTKSGYYLYEGNNPWQAEEAGVLKMRRALEEYVREHGASRDEAGRALGMAYIREDLAGFVGRCFERAKTLWGPDWFIVRHLLYAAYPPLPLPVTIALLVIVAASFPVLISCILHGICGRGAEFRYRSLLLTCVLFSMLPNVLCVVNSRMTLPLLAMLLPAAGVGLAALAERRAWGRGVILLAVTAVGLWALNPQMPRVALGAWNQASAYYLPVAGFIERNLSRWDIATADRFALRYTGDKTLGPVRLTIANGPYFFVPSISRSLVWTELTPGEVRDVTIRAPRTATSPPVVQLTLLQTGRSQRLCPVRRDAWRHWRPTALDGIEYYWAGSAGLLDIEGTRLLKD